MKPTFLFIAILIQSISLAQPNELTLPDTILSEPLQLFLFEDVITFNENFDTSYSDDQITIYEHNDSWAPKIFLQRSSDSEIKYFLIFDPDVNTSVDSVNYFDLSQDGKDEALIYYSRTDGTSGQSGGFSDHGFGLMIIDLTNSEIIMDVEYAAYYENWEQDYNEEDDEYINLGSECASFQAEVLYCAGIVYLVETQRACEEAPARFYYYKQQGANMIRIPWGVENGNPCP